MSHEILTNEETGESSLVYTGDINVWHGLGFRVDEVLTAARAVEIIGSDFEIVMTPNCTPHPDGVTEEFQLVNGSTIWRPPIAKYGIDDWKEIGQVSPDYALLQTSMIAEMLDAPDDEGNTITKRWPVKTHGIISNGTRVFFSLDGGSFSVKGEEVQRTVSLLDDKTGTGAFVITVGGVVVVCRNTWLAAESSANISTRLIHKGDLAAEVKDRLEFIRDVQEAMNREAAECQAMAGKTLNDDDVQTLLKKTYPGAVARKRLVVAAAGSDDYAAAMKRVTAQRAGEKLKGDLATYEVERDRVETYRAGVLTEYEKFNDDKGRKAHGTAWAMFNAVTAYVDHEQIVRGNEMSRELYKQFGKGSEAKARAYDACVAVSAKK